MKASFLFLFFAAVPAALAADEAPKARIAHFDGDRAAAISYTFDDNLRDQYTLAVPMLNEVGFKGTFFIIPGPTAETPEQAEKMKLGKRAWGSISWPELKEMAAQGHEIGSHTWSHPNLKNLPPDAVEVEFGKAVDAIKEHIGKPPLTLAFPFNASTPAVQAAALKYHVAYRAYQMGTSEKSTVASLNAWADKQVKDKKWGVVMTHAIANGYAALSDPEILRAHFKYVKAHEGEIWVDAFANVARYEKERDTAKLTVTQKADRITCTLSDTLDPQIYNVPLTIIIDAKGVTSAAAARGNQTLPVRISNGAIYLQAAPSDLPIEINCK